MKKTLLVGSILAVSSSVALANPTPYVGGSVGIVNNSMNVKIRDYNQSVNVGNYRGAPVNVFAGVGGLVNDNFYLAGELSGTVATANISKDNNGLKTSYGLGASVIPGIKISDNSMLYGRAGVVRARYDGMRNGGQVGVGLQTALTQNIDLRTEYDFVAYKSIDAKDSSGHKVASFAPRSDQFNVGLVYKFD